MYYLCSRSRNGSGLIVSMIDVKICRKIAGRNSGIVVALTVVVGLMLVSLSVYGKNINLQKAVAIAEKYVSLTHGVDAKVPTEGLCDKPDNPYYIFNDAQGRGFVVVAGDDVMGEVLAYGNEAPLDTLNANPCVKLLLDGYRQTYEALKEGWVSAEGVARAGLYTKTVQPLLKSKWGQSHPFNAKTLFYFLCIIYLYYECRHK